jgi:uncharacterized secreted protein with C-terminal beta-propeller domain
MQNQINKKLAIGIIVFFCFLVFIPIAVKYELLDYEEIVSKLSKISWPKFPKLPWSKKVEGIAKFSSEEEFKEYLQNASVETEYWGGGLGGGVAFEMMREMVPTAAPDVNGKGAEPERVSETNVQVVGIDEPDIVKTDGKEIYFSHEYQYWWGGPIILEERILPPDRQSKTNIIKAFPVSDLALDGEIDKSGNLLLLQNNLMIFSGDKIYSYNVSNPKSPVKKWEISLESQNYLVGARLYKDKLYLITRNQINEAHPCPIKPLIADGVALSIECSDIYHPVLPVPSDATFVAMIVNTNSGKVENKTSFLGSSASSIVYMSENAIYVTYTYYESMVKFFSNFLTEKAKDIFPAWFVEKMEKLNSYDISQSAKLTEFQVLYEKYINSLDSDDRLRIENEITNRMSDYYKDHKRDLEKTGIVKITLADFEIKAHGNVSGSPLNQFSLDEYKENLRIATTVGDRWWGLPFGVSGAESVSDVYVLNENLEIQGKVQDLGKTERIYSVRFIEDKGYVVTFKQTDPFYVLDLSNPKKPELKGELKIPGYSGYLHPITKDKILGIGQESWQIKISLFDVSSASNPKEQDKYILDESWSDILNNHHAFLLDKKHEIFFLPGSKGGYIFSYKNNELSLVKTVSETSVRRAIYINDYLYIIGDNNIVVLNELNWERVKELELEW